MHQKRKGKKKANMFLKRVSQKVGFNYGLHTNAAFKAPKEESQRIQKYARPMLRKTKPKSPWECQVSSNSSVK